MPSFGSRVGRAEDCGPFGVEQEANYGRRFDGLSGRRSELRRTLVLAASAQAIDRSGSVVISDLSHQGAKLRGYNLPTCETELLITTGTVAVFATVLWSENDECGLRFDPPLDDALFEQVEQEGNWATVMGIV